MPLSALGDASSDAESGQNRPLREAGGRWEHVPRTAKSARSKEVVPPARHAAVRYYQRTVVERFDSRIKEEFAGSMPAYSRLSQGLRAIPDPGLPGFARGPSCKVLSLQLVATTEIEDEG